MSTEDEAFDRLTGADPADGTTTREGVLRAKVDALVDGSDETTASGSGAAQGAAPRPAADTAGDAPGDELAPRRRRRASVLVAAAVAGAVVVGGGGYAVGTATAEGEWESTADSLPPITLGGGEGGQGGRAAGDVPAAAEAADGPASDAAGSMATEEMGATDMASPAWFDGRTTFSQQGLSTAGGESTAYAYDATTVATEEGAASLAETLGVSGEPRWEWSSWVVGPQDGTEPSVSVSVDGTAYFHYSDPAADPWRCEEVEALQRQEEQSAVDGGEEPDTMPVPACDPPEGTVSQRDAVDAVSAMMEQIGVDPGRFELEPSEDGEPGARWVTAHEVVGGQRTGATWNATVSTDGVAWLDGFLAPTVELGAYPVISPAEAVERLADPRFGQNVWPITYGPAAEARLAQEIEEPGPTAPPAPPSSGVALPWGVRDVTITEARLGLAQEHRQGQATLLLPAYELSDAEGNVWTVVAVADDALDMTQP